jgi:hypothetical protein
MPAINQRNCQPCTACCEGWLDIQHPIAKAHLGAACTHCTGQGCGIYNERPQNPCQSFHCAWRQEGSLLPQTMRPNLSGVIVMTDQLQWQGEDVIVAVATGARIPARSFHWLCRASTGTSICAQWALKNSDRPWKPTFHKKGSWAPMSHTNAASSIWWRINRSSCLAWPKTPAPHWVRFASTPPRSCVKACVCYS